MNEAIYLLVLIAGAVLWFKTRRSFFVLPVLVALSLLARDDYYPLSWFPMYGDPDEKESFQYLATFEDSPEQPVPLKIRDLTGLTAPKVKKMWNRYSGDLAEALKKDKSDLTPEERNEVGRQMFAEFDKMAAQRAQTLPANLAIIEVLIEENPGKGWTETPHVLASRP
ncbi:MAG: hypothetical protein H7A52_17600 [Akkermansiaceae bacterium]|nr:hypothetical protein [Akkermansiaceae bacterium]